MITLNHNKGNSMNGIKPFSRLALSVCAALPLLAVAGQTTPVRGLHDNSSTYIALQNATIVTEPGKKLENATLVINNGEVVAVARNNRAPEGARVIDASGHTIYPGFIDAYSNYGVPAVEKPDRPPYRSTTPQYNNKREGGNAANDAIHSQVDWVDKFATDSKAAKDYINQGFTSVQSARLDGIFQGQSVTVSLADTTANNAIYIPRNIHLGSYYMCYSLQQSKSSLKANIALIRNILSDAT